MTTSAIAAPLFALARLIGSAGAALTVASLVAWAFWYFYATGGSVPDVGILAVYVVGQTVLAIWVVRGVFERAPRPLFRILLLAFAGSFVLCSGWYFLLFGGLTPLFLLGAGNLLYLVAAMLIAPAALVARRATRQVEHEPRDFE